MKRKDPWYIALGIWIVIGLTAWLILNSIHECITNSQVVCY